MKALRLHRRAQPATFVHEEAPLQPQPRDGALISALTAWPGLIERSPSRRMKVVLWVVD
jgi:hypothetical protein